MLDYQRHGSGPPLVLQHGFHGGAGDWLPLIFDAAAGFGDPMHMRRTIAMSEAADFQAIEIEDQWLPKRAHHHVGLEHMVEKEIMAAKVEEAVRVRRSADLLIVARTNAVRGRVPVCGRSPGRAATLRPHISPILCRGFRSVALRSL